MNIVEKTETRMASSAADCERFRLRGFIESLPADELETRAAPVDLADVAAVLEDNPKAVMFGAVGPERAQLVGNVTGSRSRIARAFGVAASELSGETAMPSGLTKATCEVLITGDIMGAVAMMPGPGPPTPGPPAAAGGVSGALLQAASSSNSPPKMPMVLVHIEFPPG